MAACACNSENTIPAFPHKRLIRLTLLALKKKVLKPWEEKMYTTKEVLEKKLY